MGMNSDKLQSAIAHGAIGAFCFVERDPNGTSLLRVNQGTVNGRSIGIGPSYSTLDAGQIVYAYSGLEYLMIGSGGCKAGDRLKSDTNGNGVVVATGGSTIQNVGGYATQDANSGDVILVQIENYVESAADYLS